MDRGPEGLELAALRPCVWWVFSSSRGDDTAHLDARDEASLILAVGEAFLEVAGKRGGLVHWR